MDLDSLTLSDSDSSDSESIDQYPTPSTAQSARPSPPAAETCPTPPSAKESSARSRFSFRSRRLTEDLARQLLCSTSFTTSNCDLSREFHAFAGECIVEIVVCVSGDFRGTGDVTLWPNNHGKKSKNIISRDVCRTLFFSDPG